ncbi:MAG: hypothetical protein PVH50_07215 [Anaerolineae bacterium]|jgi:hypothetical protein
MSKRERHKQDLVVHMEAFFETGDAQDILTYLVSNGNLPHPRANLELAHAFADLVETYAERDVQKVWDLCVPMVDVPADQAPTNDPREFIPFCGAIGIGAIGSVSAEFQESALISLRRLASDPRWRMREAVCFGLQRLLAKHTRTTMRAVEGWIQGEAWLEMRAVAAAVAEPSLLESRETALSALHIHAKILDEAKRAEDRKSQTFRVLRKGLGYTLSVVVRALPDQGFSLLEELADSGDSDLLWILRQNVRKKRLARNFPSEVESLQRRMGG